MKPFQLRVIDERQELESKIKSLSEFLQNKTLVASLPKEEVYLLVEQLLHMRDYSCILAERIKLFNKQEIVA